MDRYNRHIILDEIGPEGQKRIGNASVLVIGAGGLGCPALQYLCAAGVGRIGIVDHDVVDETNLQRQVLYGMETLGKNKAFAARERLLDLNPTIRIDAYPERLTALNALGLFKEYDIILDGSDNFPTRYLANDASVLTGKPLVFGAIYKFEGQVSVFNFKGGPSYRCLFPNTPQKKEVPNCAEIGVLGVLPGIIGCMQANEVLKIILGLGDVLSGKLWCFDALTSQTYSIKVKRNEEVISEVMGRGILQEEDLIFCDTGKDQVSLDDLFELEDMLLVDVREVGEKPMIQHPDIIQLPLSDIKGNTIGLDQGKTLVTFCQQGQRSRIATDRLRKMGYSRALSLVEGARELITYLESYAHEKH